LKTCTMHSTLLLAGLSALVAVTYSIDLCSPGWNELQGNCYQNVSREFLRVDADNTCALKNAHLPSVDNDDVMKFLGDMHDHHPTRTAIWLDMKKPYAEWGHNQGLVSFDKWGANEPNSARDGCATLQVDDSSPRQATHYMSRPCGQYLGWRPQVICKRPVNKIKQIKIEVAAKPNAQAVDAKCSLGYGAGAPVEFTAAGGSSFPNGGVLSFAAPAGLGAGNYMSLRLDCSSVSGDALQVSKLEVVVSNVGNFHADMNVVYDDPASCNVDLVEGVGACIQSQVNIVMA